MGLLASEATRLECDANRGCPACLRLITLASLSNSLWGHPSTVSQRGSGQTGIWVLSKPLFRPRQLRFKATGRTRVRECEPFAVDRISGAILDGVR